jgi:uncharacterized protein
MKALWISFLIGLTGSIHCVGMCGPLISLSGIFKESKTDIYSSFLQYHSGRIIMYAFLGAMLGWLGYVTEFIGYVKYITIGMATVLVLYAILSLWGIKININGKYYSSTPIYLYNKIIKSQLPFKTFLLGGLNGLVPCGLVYSAMVLSFMNNDIKYGVMNMVVFGLGTLPALFMSVYGFTFIKINRQSQIYKFQYVGLLLSGGFLLYRALLLNIDPNTSLWASLINQKMCSH